LNDYRKVAPDSFWEQFPINLVQPAVSNIDGAKLSELARDLGCSDLERLNRVLGYIEHGADIGCKGEFREESSSSNAKSTYESGPEVSDSIATWLTEGYAFGPVKREEVPKGAKINGMMVRKKPNGSARIILNLSAPKGKSVNEGINADDFPAVMSSTGAWLEVLNKAGVGAWMAKTDWAAAYKQITVRSEDTDLQWFQWAGRYFKELCLIFRSASSAGIFDDTAKVVLDFVCRRAEFPRNMVCQHLDDICAAASRDSTTLHRFDQEFIKLASEIGVKLAPRDDPEKSFGPSKKGTVFGISYDTEKLDLGSTSRENEQNFVRHRECQSRNNTERERDAKLGWQID